MTGRVITTTVVTSADGTRIGLHTVGGGPGLVVLPGTLRAAKHYRDLADALAADFTVHTVDRRGRGDSGAQGAGYGIDTECADLAAVLAHTGARLVFGHSYGGLVALETVLRLPDATIEKLAVHEPAVSVGGAFTDDWLPELASAIAEGRTVDGVVAVLSGLDLVGELRHVPSRMRAVLLRALPHGEMLADLRALLPTVAAEVSAARELDSAGERYAGVGTRTLLLDGDRSPDYLRHVTTLLADTLPDATRTTIPQAGHNAPDLDRPLVVAQRLRDWFTA
jgi:pimeloyl-ACP methyl ester carboxylesterase